MTDPKPVATPERIEDIVIHVMPFMYVIGGGSLAFAGDSLLDFVGGMLLITMGLSLARLEGEARGRRSRN